MSWATNSPRNQIQLDPQDRPQELKRVPTHPRTTNPRTKCKQRPLPLLLLLPPKIVQKGARVFFFHRSLKLTGTCSKASSAVEAPSVSEKKIEELFDHYAPQKDVMGPDEVMQFCEDLQVDPEDVRHAINFLSSSH